MSMLQVDRRTIANFDWFLFGLVLALNGVGILNLSSAAAGSGLWKTQLMWFGLGLLAAFFAAALDYKRLERFAVPLYLACVALLLGVHFFGYRVSGAKSWYHLGFARFQPSELSKLALIIITARFYQRNHHGRPWTFREILLPSAAAAVPVVSVFMEPDPGTAFIIFLVFATMLLFAGIQRRLILLAAAGLAAFVLAYPVWKKALKPHQQKRIEIFLHPEKDPLGAGYNALQAKIAVGSGGFSGKKYKKGAMHMLRFLPEQQTDFVFAVWAEEWGFAGVLAVLALYFVFLMKALFIAQEAKDKFGVMLAVGCAGLFFWHIFINTAMVVGLFPIIGVPLPFMSYGGSNLMTSMLAAGLLINVKMRKYFF